VALNTQVQTTTCPINYICFFICLQYHISVFNTGEIPNCQRCPYCFDSGLEYINELATNITALTMTLNQLISTSAPLSNISDIFSKLDRQLFQAQSALQSMPITRSNVTLLENKANNVS